MPRLIVLVNSPYHLKPLEAEEWLRGEASKLAALRGVERGLLCRLANPSDRNTAHWSWLIELQCDAADTARLVVRDTTWLEVLGDLRLLGMRPSVALVADARTLAG